MGIPKFYRWLSERYPLINQPGGATVVPIIDNLYLDMNGIIHNCTHGNDPNVSLTEDEMILRIFTYLDKLFQIIKPQKLLFMAIDGVAPRAKMNQQRSRRFKTAREAQDLAAKKAPLEADEQEKPPSFDSNCITPGTPFMVRLGAHFRFFIRKKMAEDPDWRRPTIVFSGHDVPGEGEHKIMEHIRWAKRVGHYPPNTRHCMYGLDADLIMLALVTHEPHFCLLREVVKYTGGGQGQPAREALENPCAEHFVLLQIGLLREYFELEFKPATPLPFPFSVERVVDDFVLFCMLVGNDFLPPLPTVDIAEGSLETMFEVYKELLPQMGGYLTHAGKLHHGRLEVFLGRLALLEAQVLLERAENTEKMESRRRRGGDEGAPAWASERVDARRRQEAGAGAGASPGAGAGAQPNRYALLEPGRELELLARTEGEEEEEEEEEDAGRGPPAGPAITDSSLLHSAPLAPPQPLKATMMSKEARALFLDGDADQALVAWKERLYNVKMGLPVDAAARRAVVEAYVQGIHWVLEYYYRGVASWNWYYPYHYAPMASDLVNVSAVKVDFTHGEPFLPYEQLLAVQPAASCMLLPKAYRKFMLDPESPIHFFYPTNFGIDLEGKRAEWEGVVLIPFVDEEKLLAVSRSIDPASLTEEERVCNAHGPIVTFKYAGGPSEETTYCTSTLPAVYGDVAHCNSLSHRQAPLPPLPDGQLGFIPKLVPGTKTGKGAPGGFPSLRVLSVKGAVKMAGCDVFGMASKRPSLIVSVAAPGEGQTPAASALAPLIIGKKVWIRWPYLLEGLVVGVGSETSREVSPGQLSSQHPTWREDVAHAREQYLNKRGVDIGPAPVWVEVRPLDVLVRHLDGSLEARYQARTELVPLHLVIRRHPNPDPRHDPGALKQGLAHLAPGTRGVVVKGPYFGCTALVLPPEEGQEPVGKAGGPPRPLRVAVTPPSPSAANVARMARSILSRSGGQFRAAYVAAKRLGVSPSALGRISGSLWIKVGEDRRDRYDVGLCVRNAGKGVAVPDAVRFQPNERYSPAPADADGGAPHSKGTWEYSDTVLEVLRRYKDLYPWVWAAVEADPKAYELDATAVAPGETDAERIQAAQRLHAWLQRQPLAQRPLLPLGTTLAGEADVRALQAALPPAPQPPPAVLLTGVQPAMLAAPLARGQVVYAVAGGAFELGDRVVALGGTGVPPFGVRGSVTGVLEGAVEVVFDEPFVGGSDLAGRCAGQAGALCPPQELLRLGGPRPAKAQAGDTQQTPPPARPAWGTPGAANNALPLPARARGARAPMPAGATVPAAVPAAARRLEAGLIAGAANGQHTHAPPPPPSAALLAPSVAANGGAGVETAPAPAPAHPPPSPANPHAFWDLLQNANQTRP